MNITLVNTWRVIDAKGGTEKVFCDMANALSRRGHNVTAICCDNKDGKPGFPLDNQVKLVNAGLSKIPSRVKLIQKIRAFTFRRKDRRKKRKALAWEYKLHTALSKIEADVVVSFQMRTTYAIKKTLGDSVPLVTMMHGVPSVYFKDPVSALIKSSVESSNVIQVLRPEFSEVLLSFLPKANIVVIPNAVPQTPDSSDCLTKTIINVARASPEKRQTHLLEAFSLISKQFPDWKLELWGETHVNPAYTKKVQAIIEEHKLQNQVSLCGTTDNVFQQLKQSSIFAFPSEFEGFGLALAEAMSMGLPSIGWKECPAVNTLIRNGENGLLCDATPESLAQALATLMRDADLRIRLGKQAKEDMKAYAPELIWNQWESLLHSLIDSKK